MATYRYRAATASGVLRSGALQAASRADVLQDLRRLGLMPIETVETSAPAKPNATARPNAKTRQAVINAIGELAVLLQAGLTLDRALAVCVENILNPVVKAVFATVHSRVKEGAPLSRAMAESAALFPPVASAMAEAGEADGRLGASLARLADSLDRAEALRQTVVSSLVYPAMLIVVATSVIMVMLLVVVPQFEGLFADTHGKLPFATRAVMAVSDGVRTYGWLGLIGLGLAVFALRQWLRRPGVRLAFDTPCSACRRSVPWSSMPRPPLSPAPWVVWWTAACPCPPPWPSLRGRYPTPTWPARSPRWPLASRKAAASPVRSPPAGSSRPWRSASCAPARRPRNWVRCSAAWPMSSTAPSARRSSGYSPY